LLPRRADDAYASICLSACACLCFVCAGARPCRMRLPVRGDARPRACARVCACVRVCARVCARPCGAIVKSFASAGGGDPELSAAAPRASRVATFEEASWFSCAAAPELSLRLARSPQLEPPSARRVSLTPVCPRCTRTTYARPTSFLRHRGRKRERERESAPESKEDRDR
jgi:hypothetical protein